MNLSLKEIADWVDGVVDGAEASISKLATLHDADSTSLTFLDGPRRLKDWEESQAPAALVPRDFPATRGTLIRVDHPLKAFQKILLRLFPRYLPPRALSPLVEIDDSAQLGIDASIASGTFIGPHTTIGDHATLGRNVYIGAHCKIGNNVHLHPNVVLYDHVTLGDNVIIHANSTIGADGFGYEMVKGSYLRIPQLGGVVIGDDVEIGAAVTIDSGTCGPTQIGRGTKIDNQVMIGHNCIIGEHVIMAGQVGIAGSCIIEDYVVLAGQVGIADHLRVGTKAVLAAQSGLTKNIPPGEIYFGTPARPRREAGKEMALLTRLPRLFAEVEEIKRHLAHRQEDDA